MRWFTLEETLLPIEEFNELLKNWEGKYIKVSKYEKNDHDETFLKLNRVSYKKKSRRVDDYEPMHTLELNGSGKVRIAQDDYEPLPNSLYEIPLEDNSEYKFDGSRFSLNTDRGVYIIEIAPESAD